MVGQSSFSQYQLGEMPTQFLVKGSNVMSNFGSVEATHHMWLFFSKQVDILEKIRVKTLEQQGEVWSVLMPLLYAISDSSATVKMISKVGKLRDSFVIGRVVFETAINAMFICSQGDEVARKAKRHAHQKAYRDLERVLEINSEKISLRWTGKDSLPNDQELQDALDEFTSRNGREVTNWTPENVKERIEKISSKYGTDVSRRLQFGLLSIYRHASEIAHGSVFGALYVLGLTSPGGIKSPEELEYLQRGQLSMTLLMLGLTISALIIVIETELGDNELTMESKACFEILKEEPWLKESLQSGQGRHIT